MKDITVNELIDKKIELEAYLIKEMTRLLLKFQKETGYDVKDVRVKMKDVYNGMFYCSDEMNNLRYYIENVEVDIDLVDF